MYKSWYAAHINQLTADEAAAFLSLLDTLDRDTAPDDVRAFALDEMRQKVELNLQIYALPWLARIALGTQPLAEAAIALLQQICSDTGNAACRRVAGSLAAHAALGPAMTDALPLAGNPSLRVDEYVNLTGRIAPVLLLSLLPALPVQQAEQLLAEEGWGVFLREAQEGRHGRYALILALEACSALHLPVEESVRKRIAAYPGFELQPDLVQAYLACYFAGKSALDIKDSVYCPGAYLADRCLQQENRHTAPNAQSWLYQGRDRKIEQPEHAEHVLCLWEYTACMMAARRARREGTLPHLTEALCRHWHRLRDTSQTRGPWAQRAIATYNRTGNTHFAEYPSMSHQAVTMRHSMAAPLCGLLLAHLGEEAPPFLMELTLNLYDAFANPTVRAYVTKGNWNTRRSLSPAAILLMAYACEITSQAGKGYLNDRVPAAFYRLVEEKSIPILCGEETALTEQEMRLHSGASVLCCAFLSYDQASGDMPGLREGRYWMAGDDDSLAHKICRIALGDLWQFILHGGVYRNVLPEQLITTAVALAYEHFPACIDELHPAVEDWLSRFSAALAKGNLPSSAPELRLSDAAMLLRRYDAQEWAEVPMPLTPPDDKAYRFRLSALTHKILATLRGHGELTDMDKTALETWVEALVCTYDPEKYARLLRFSSSEVLSELLHDEVFLMLFRLRRTVQNREEQWTQYDARDIAQAVTEAVLDTSRGAIFYQYTIGQAILAAGLDAHQATSHFIMLVYCSMLLHQCAEDAASMPRLLTPYRRMEYEHSARGRRELLQWFLYGIRASLQRDHDLRRDMERILNRRRTGSGVMCTAFINQDSIILDTGEKSKIVAADMRRWNHYWDPDTLTASLRPGMLQAACCAYQDSGVWKPVERDFTDFLVEQSANVNDNGTTRLVLIEADGEGVLASAAPGFNYRLPASVWEDASLQALHDRVEQIAADMESATACGLYMDVCLTQRDGLPCLCISGMDDANQRYAELFQPEESFGPGMIGADGQITRDGFTVAAMWSHKADYMILGSPWNIVAQRKRKVWLAPDKDVQQLYCPPGGEKELLEHYLQLRYGQLIQLGWTSACTPGMEKQQTLLARTIHGMPVQAESDGAALDHYRLKTSRIPCVARITSVPARTAHPNGIVRQYKRGGNITLAYLDDNGSVNTCEAPASALGVEESSIYPGLPVAVDSHTGAVLPVQEVRDENRRRLRRYIVRHLWPMTHAEGPAQLDEGSVYIGQYYLPGASEAVYLVQDLIQHQLIAYRQDAPVRPDTACGVCLSKGKALVKASLFARDIIEFRQGDQAYYGEAEKGVFSNVAVRCAQAGVSLTEYTWQGQTYYDVQRVFAQPILERAAIAPRMVTAPAVPRDQGKRLAGNYYAAYQEWQQGGEWLEDNRLHAEGILVKGADGAPAFHPTLPLACFPRQADEPSREDPHQWVTAIPLEESSIRAMHLGNASIVYAAIRRDENGKLIACPGESAMFSMDRFQRWLTRKQRNQQIYTQYPLYFQEKQGENLIFTWGMGLRVAVAENCLRVTGNAVYNLGSQLFFGDMIRRYRILREEDTLYLCVSIEDYELSLEHRIQEDAGRRIVQYLKVRYDRLRDAVETSEVSVTRRRLDVGNPPWQLEDYRNGLLHEETEAYVRSILPEGGEGYLLVRPEWSLDNMKHRFRHVALSSIARDDILCLKGGEIKPTGSGNDFYVPFRMEFESGTLLGESTADFEVRVNRRNFSYNESVLRAYYTKNQRDIFTTSMLVKVRSCENGRRYGTLRALPVRHAWYVREWLRIYGPQHVVIGDMDANKVRVEIKPGVFCHATARGSVREGATGRLWLENDMICVQAIAESDQQFCTPGRVVDLLMMDSCFAKAGMQPGAHFTVAGLPQVMLQNKELALAHARRQPPRWGVLGEGGAVSPVTDTMLHGRLRAETDDTGRQSIRLYQFNRRQPQNSVMFHHLSFMDGGVFDLYHHIRRGQWHYHDRQTRVILPNGNTVDHFYGEGSDLPLIFHGMWSLRYPKEFLARYAFPPHELEEYGLPEAQGGQYPVAAAIGSHLYIELSPGRIIRIPDRLLKIGGVDEVDGKLCTRYISTGDMVQLSSREAEPGKPIEILLQGVRGGLRGMMEQKAYLPVCHIAPGKLTLGGGITTLAYPTFAAGKLSVGQVVVLDKDNNLYTNLTMPSPGDLVMLRLGENGEMQAAGFEQLIVTLAETGTRAWCAANPFWLRRSLETPDGRTEIMALMQGAIPMRVEQCDGQAIALSYPQPAQPFPGDVLCCQMVGVRNGWTLVLRAGSFLLLVNMAQLLNVANDQAAAILSHAQQQGVIAPGKEIWIRCDQERRFRIGLFTQPKRSRTVRLLATVDAPAGSGYLCQDDLSREWLWMPLHHVARAQNARAAQVRDVLRKYVGSPIELTVTTDNAGRASWLQDNVALQLQFDKLSPGNREQTISVIVASDDLAAEGAGEHIYLCHERPQGNIYELRAELPKQRGDAVEAVCCEKTRHDAVLRPAQEIRTAVHLSAHLLTALDRTSTRRGINKRALAAHYPPMEAEIQAFRQGDTDAQSPSNRLMALCRRVMAQQQAHQSVNDPQVIALRQEAKCVLADFADAWQPDASLPLPTALALAIAAWRIDEMRGQEIYYRIGRTSLLYGCESFLLEKWLLDNSFYGMNDLRRLLEMIDLRGMELNDDKANSAYAGRLTPGQEQQAKRICNTVRRRYRTEDQAVHALLASCLQFAMGDCSESALQGLWADCRLNKLQSTKVLGRLLGTEDVQPWFEALLASPSAHITVHGSSQLITLAKTAAKE